MTAATERVTPATDIATTIAHISANESEENTRHDTGN